MFVSICISLSPPTYIFTHTYTNVYIVYSYIYIFVCTYAQNMQ